MFKSYKNSERVISGSLKGAGIVLMVASFEQFLKYLFEEKLNELSVTDRSLNFDKFPDKMKTHSICIFIDLLYHVKEV